MKTITSVYEKMSLINLLVALYAFAMMIMVFVLINIK